MKRERPCLSNERQGRFWCLIQDGHTLHPVEIKAGMTVRRDAIKNFTELESMQDFEVGYGHVICQVPELYPLSSRVQAIPVLMLQLEPFGDSIHRAHNCIVCQLSIVRSVFNKGLFSHPKALNAFQQSGVIG